MTKKRMALVPPRQTPWHYTLGCHCSGKPSDPPFPRRGSRVLEDKCSVWACTKPERFPIPYLHFMNTISRAEYYSVKVARLDFLGGIPPTFEH